MNDAVFMYWLQVAHSIFIVRLGLTTVDKCVPHGEETLEGVRGLPACDTEFPVVWLEKSRMAITLDMLALEFVFI